MRNQLLSLFDILIKILLLVVAALTPLIVYSQMTEYYEMPKLVFLIVTTLLLYAFWIISWIIKGKVSFTRTPLDIPLLLLLVTVIASTFFSSSRMSAIYGNFPQVTDSAVAWVTYIMLYFVTVSNLKTTKFLKIFLYALYASAVIVAGISLLSFFGVYLPFDIAHATNFTPTGSTFSTVAFALLLLPLPLVSILRPNKYMPTTLAVVLALLFGVTVALLGSVSSYIVMLIAVVLSLLIPKARHIKKRLLLFLIPIVVTAITLALVYMPTAGLGSFEARFPKEIQLPIMTSWKIAASVLRDAPVLGTGPATYLFNFTAYKPAEFNTYSFWSFTFDTAYNEFLQVMGTLGVLGFVSLLLLVVILLVFSWKSIFFRPANHEDESMKVVYPALSISGILVVVLMSIHAVTLVSVVVAFMVMAALMIAQPAIREKVTNFSLSKSHPNEHSFDLFPVIIFVVFLIGAAFVLYNTSNTVLADYWHRKALSQASTNGTLTYQYLQKAEDLNPYIDLYRVDMAQTNFALANAMVTQKGPTKDNPKGTLSDKDKTTVKTLITQAVNEGRVAVALSPRSARDLGVLGSIYRNIAGVSQNAIPFSLDAYGRAIQRDPLNPSLRLTVGGIYYATKNYSQAIRFFTDAINLKTDYVNAYYNLAIALRDSNDLQNALAVAKQAVVILNQQHKQKTDDYKVTTQLVNEIQQKIETAAKAKTEKTTPTQTSADQSKSASNNAPVANLKVNSLSNPPQTTPPPPVKANENANIPQVSVSPTQGE